MGLNLPPPPFLPLHNRAKNLGRDKLKKGFAFETDLIRKYQSEKISNLSDILFKLLKRLFFSFFFSTQRGLDIPECLFVSPYSHKFLTDFNFNQFCRHFNIEKYLKSLKVLFFFSVIFPLLMYVF